MASPQEARELGLSRLQASDSGFYRDENQQCKLERLQQLEEALFMTETQPPNQRAGLGGETMCGYFWASLAALSIGFVSLPAQAQICADRAELVERLGEEYRERPAGFGVSNAGALVELLVSDPEAPRQTWSIIVTVPGGRTCLQAAGEGWRSLTKDPTDPET